VPTDNQYRWVNPAGFQVTRYRKDQQNIPRG
jgi:type IV secretory pathway component VirB8